MSTDNRCANCRIVLDEATGAQPCAIDGPSALADDWLCDACYFAALTEMADAAMARAARIGRG